MARILNFLIVILEVIGFSKSFKWHGFKKNFIYYTQISNLTTLASSVLLVLFGTISPVEVVRFLSVCMMIMTFIVTACILVPMSGKAREFLFSGSGLFQHLIIPVVSTSSYMFLEKRVDIKWMWLPFVVSILYEVLMV